MDLEIKSNQQKEKTTNENLTTRQIGFTLIEIVFAVLILSISVVTLLGLQSSATARALRDREGKIAMLAARTLLSAIEKKTNPEALSRSRQGSYQEIKNLLLPDSEFQFDLSDRIPSKQTNAKLDNDFYVTLEISFIDLPKIGERALKRIDLTLYRPWELTNPIFNGVYYIPADDVGSVR
ncbi:MAG TPA: hypothetical protein PKD37_06845 [Oligoflexia bacterium]|nr:hypothetical protein [Oligoflexia bacterium]HMP27680.1 hypothetical protein [Oligoflexia bacterium]